MKTSLKPRKKGSQQRSQETVESILQATTHILSEGDSHEMSTNKIAARAGVSIGSLYQYFPSKESILNALLEKHLEWKLNTISEQLNEIVQRDLPPEKAVEEFVELLISLKLKNLKLERALTYYFFHISDFETLRKLDMKIIEKIKQTFLPLQSRFPGFDPDWSVFVLFYTLRGVIVSAGTHPQFDVKSPKLKQELVRLLKGYLLS